VADFVAGPENALAGTVVQLLLKDDFPLSPWLIYGPPAVGKTHVALGLAALWQRQYSPRSLMITDGGGFARDYVLARDTKGLPDFQRRLARPGLLLIDDLDSMPRQEGVQAELVRLLDSRSRQGRSVLVTCRDIPSPRQGILPALSSRLLCGLAVPLRPPQAAARAALVTRFASHRGQPLSEQQAAAIADRFALPAPQLADAVNRLVSDAATQQKTIDELIPATAHAPPRRGSLPSLGSIATAVAHHFGMPAAELRGRSRRQAVAQARAAAMYLGRELTALSTTAIGRFFGGRHHSSVVHACRATQERLEADAVLQEAIRKIKRKIDEAIH
jgi:chromosomal replication initiator protein